MLRYTNATMIQYKMMHLKPHILLFLLVPVFVFAQLQASQYQFFFHHYNDIYSYSQLFSLPSTKIHKFFFDIDASQDASKNLTLSKIEERAFITFTFGIQPWDYLTIRAKEKIANSKIETADFNSRISKNELLAESVYRPREWIEITPYFLSISDHYERIILDSLTISNPGTGKGIKGMLDIKNIANIETEIGFLDQAISNEKKALVDLSFDQPFLTALICGNIEGKNIVTQYPILQGVEEKFLESMRGNVFTDFSPFNHLVVFTRYDGGYKNEIYSLLQGFGGKHTNEKRMHHDISSTVNYQIHSKLRIDINAQRYNGTKTFQDGISDEYSEIKTITPTVHFQPHQNSDLSYQRTIRLSSFTFPNPLTVTDRDILEKADLFVSKYELSKGTDLSLSFGRTENHIIYVRSEMSANNVTRTKYAVEAVVNRFAPQKFMIEESFSLIANYQIYDYSSQKNLFTRSFSHQSKLLLLILHTIRPSFKYKLIKQDWGPYLFSYQTGEYLFYPNIENKKQSYELNVELKPLSTFTLTPAYTVIKNQFINLSNESNQFNSILIEEHYSLSMEYNEAKNKFIDLSITWVKRNNGKNFFIAKAKISYGV